MSINYIKGDLFNYGPHKIICHGVNTEGVMGAGFAKKLKVLFPNNYKKYNDTCYLYESKDTHKLMGLNFIYEEKNTLIINSFTQLTYGYGNRFASYDAIDRCMKDLNHFMKHNHLDNFPISMPKIGAGLGGGNWNIIEKIISENLPTKTINVYHLD